MPLARKGDMNTKITRGRLVTFTAIAIAAVGAIVGVVLSQGSSTPPVQRPLPSVMQCSGKTQNEPASYVLACADDNSELLKIHWTTWSSSIATGSAIYSFNDCNPYCAAGKFVSYPAQVRLSSPRTTTHGLLFTEVTIDYQQSTTKSIVLHQSLPTLSLAESVTSTSAPRAAGSG